MEEISWVVSFLMSSQIESTAEPTLLCTFSVVSLFSNIKNHGIMGTVLLIIWKQMIRSTIGRFHKERTLQTKKH